MNSLELNFDMQQGSLSGLENKTYNYSLSVPDCSSLFKACNYSILAQRVCLMNNFLSLQPCIKYLNLLEAISIVLPIGLNIQFDFKIHLGW